MTAEAPLLAFSRRNALLATLASAPFACRRSGARILTSRDAGGPASPSSSSSQPWGGLSVVRVSSMRDDERAGRGARRRDVGRAAGRLGAGLDRAARGEAALPALARAPGSGGAVRERHARQGAAGGARLAGDLAALRWRPRDPAAGAGRGRA